MSEWGDKLLTEADNARLRAENADLREQLADCRGANELLDWVNERLRDENAKLRELVRYMWEYDYAGHFSTCQEHIDHSAIVYQRMCALGVEVDE